MGKFPGHLGTWRAKFRGIIVTAVGAVWLWKTITQVADTILTLGTIPRDRWGAFNLRRLCVGDAQIFVHAPICCAYKSTLVQGDLCRWRSSAGEIYVKHKRDKGLKLHSKDFYFNISSTTFIIYGRIISIRRRMDEVYSHIAETLWLFRIANCPEALKNVMKNI